MPIIQLKLSSNYPPLTVHGRLFREEEDNGKKTLRLVRLDPVDVRLGVAEPREVDLSAGKYHYIFSAQHGIVNFEIVTRKKIGADYYTIDSDKFEPKDPYDTFQMVCSFSVTA